jgi:hypothetical protein
MTRHGNVGSKEGSIMTDLDIEQLEELMASLPDVCDQCGKMKPGDQLNYFADGHKLCDQCFGVSPEKPVKPQPR